MRSSAKIYEALGIGRDLVKPIESRDRQSTASRTTPRKRMAGAPRRWRRRAAHGRAAVKLRMATSGRQERALELAYSYLNRRDRTVGGDARHLQARAAASRRPRPRSNSLAEQGYLDDARFARLFAEDKRDLEQWGSERIQPSAAERGIDRDLVERRSTCRGARSSSDRAVALLQRRFPSPPRDRRERERALGGCLLRKGYETELALDALAAHAATPIAPHSPPVLRCQQRTNGLRATKTPANFANHWIPDSEC